MCRTMKELENVVSDYREMKTLLDEVSEQVKALDHRLSGHEPENHRDRKRFYRQDFHL